MWTGRWAWDLIPYSIPPPVPDKPYGFNGCKAPRKKKRQRFGYRGLEAGRENAETPELLYGWGTAAWSGTIKYGTSSMWFNAWWREVRALTCWRNPQRWVWRRTPRVGSWSSPACPCTAAANIQVRISTPWKGQTKRTVKRSEYRDNVRISTPWYVRNHEFRTNTPSLGQNKYTVKRSEQTHRHKIKTNTPS